MHRTVASIVAGASCLLAASSAEAMLTKSTCTLLNRARTNFTNLTLTTGQKFFHLTDKTIKVDGKPVFTDRYLGFDLFAYPGELSTLTSSKLDAEDLEASRRNYYRMQQLLKSASHQSTPKKKESIKVLNLVPQQPSLEDFDSCSEEQVASTCEKDKECQGFWAGALLFLKKTFWGGDSGMTDAPTKPSSVDLAKPYDVDAEAGGVHYKYFGYGPSNKPAWLSQLPYKEGVDFEVLSAKDHPDLFEGLVLDPGHGGVFDGVVLKARKDLEAARLWGDKPNLKYSTRIGGWFSPHAVADNTITEEQYRRNNGICRAWPNQLTHQFVVKIKAGMIFGAGPTESCDEYPRDEEKKNIQLFVFKIRDSSVQAALGIGSDPSKDRKIVWKH